MTTDYIPRKLTDVIPDAEVFYHRGAFSRAHPTTCALDEVMTINEAAAYAQRTRETIRSWVDRGYLTYRETGYVVLILKQSIDEKLRKHK